MPSELTRRVLVQSEVCFDVSRFPVSWLEEFIARTREFPACLLDWSVERSEEGVFVTGCITACESVSSDLDFLLPAVIQPVEKALRGCLW